MDINKINGVGLSPISSFEGCNKEIMGFTSAAQNI